jgi:hypothetical protein
MCWPYGNRLRASNSSQGKGSRRVPRIEAERLRQNPRHHAYPRFSTCDNCQPSGRVGTAFSAKFPPGGRIYPFNASGGTRVRTLRTPERGWYRSVSAGHAWGQLRRASVRVRWMRRRGGNATKFPGRRNVIDFAARLDDPASLAAGRVEQVNLVDPLLCRSINGASRHCRAASRAHDWRRADALRKAGRRERLYEVRAAFLVLPFRLASVVSLHFCDSAFNILSRIASKIALLTFIGRC